MASTEIGKNNVRLNNLELDVKSMQKEVVGINCILSHQGDILKEVKNVLVKQTEIQSKQLIFEKEFDAFKEEFKNRREKTDDNNKEFRDFSSSIRGGLKVGIFCFGIIQCLIGWYVYQIDSDINKIQIELKENSKSIERLDMKINDK